MSIFDSLAEIDAHIAKAKEGLLKLSSGTLEVTLDTGLSRRNFKRTEIAALRAHLVWLRSERASMTGGSGSVVIHGRPSR